MPKKKTNKPFIHKTAVIEGDVKIGQGTKVWHFAQVRQGSKIGKNCIIGKSVFIDFETEIGDNVKIQNHAIIYHKAILEDGVFIGPNVCFTNDKTPRAINPDGSLKGAEDWQVSTIKIDRGASIGGHSVILPGVEIGEFALIGAGAVVTKNIPAFALAFGNPAKIGGFVCRCGKKIEQFIESDEAIVGKCVCGLNVPIDREAFQQYQKKDQEPKRRIWLR